MKAALLVFLLALSLHLTYFALDRDSVARDTRKYVLPAESLIAGGGYSRGGQPETERTPGYPVLLVSVLAAGLDLRQIALLQHLASAAAAGALVLIARPMTNNIVIATLSGIVMAIDLPTIHHANLILTETLFAIMLLAFVALIWRDRTAAAGLLLGAMTLVRPVAMFFFIPMAVYLAWTRRTEAMRVVPLFVVGALLLPSAWLYRNYRVSGVPTLSTNSANLMLNFHAAGALAIRDPGDFDTNLILRQHELRAVADARARAELGMRDISKLPYVRRAASDWRLGREVVLAHPFAFARLLLRGIAINFLSGGGDALTRVTTISRSTANRLLLLYTGTALILATIGQFWLLKTNRRLGVLILITIGYFIAFTAGSLAYSRFRVPVVPMYAIAVAAGVDVLVRTAKAQRRDGAP